MSTAYICGCILTLGKKGELPKTCPVHGNNYTFAQWWRSVVDIRENVTARDLSQAAWDAGRKAR